MRLLVIHQNFPGQFGYFLREWSRRAGWDVRGLGSVTAPGLEGFDQLIRYRLHRQVQQGQHPYLRQMEAATLRGQATARAMLALRKSGFSPDVVLAHPGWGETLYAKDVYPEAKLVHLCEWFYDAQGADVGFDPEFPTTFDDRARIRLWNALHTLNLTQCDLGVSPTLWQRSRHPPIYFPKIAVQHEGIALEELGRNPLASVTAPSGMNLKVGDLVVTYVARNLEPYRGFHVFMRALGLVQRQHPTCQALIVGGDEVSYGASPEGGLNWRQRLLREVDLDPSRTHFLGRVPRQEYIQILQISAAHVYLTYPFVLSWSLLEAMACGAPLIVSDTSPVREVLDESCSRQSDFFDVELISASILDSLRSAGDEERSRVAMARSARFDRRLALVRYDALLGVASESKSSAAGFTSPEDPLRSPAAKAAHPASVFSKQGVHA